VSRSAALPDGASCALGLSFDVDAETALLGDSLSSVNDPAAMTHQAFGPRVGVPRLVRMLDEEGVKATFFVPGYTARRWPATVALILEHGHEVGHHSDLHRSPLALSPEAETADFHRGLETLTDLGAVVTGFRAALWQATAAALTAAADAGLRYDSSLMQDDRPYLLTVGGRTLAELPVHWALDDWEQYGYLPAPDIGRRIETPHTLVQIWADELDAQRTAGGVCVTTAHPFLSGRASRVEAIRAFIEHAQKAGDVWIATLGEIADRTLASLRTPAVRLDDADV
jgi:peptidoglycan/xylan/chitin deacetylase (PgdA/CDA1 family)